MKLNYRTQIDLGVAVVTVLVGVFFAILALRIDIYSDDAVGPQLVPIAIAIAMLVLGVLVGVLAWRNNDRSVTSTASETQASDEFGFRGADLKRVIAVIGVGIIYIGLFHALGYLLATWIALILILLTFGNRRPALLLLLPVVGALIYQYLFMHLIGLYDPPGAWFDLWTFFKHA